ncbi:MAG: hypothetical protein H6Q99_749 [Proteobacteria bacterium]|nr:hypothetical protein [Pseudomonadota bacterium]
MARTLSFAAFLTVAASAMVVSVLASTAAVIEPPSVARQAVPVCLVGLGAGDGSPPWSQLDVTPSRSIDLDLADGAGLTVACGTVTAPTFRPTTGAPASAADPSAKGDFGWL